MVIDGVGRVGRRLALACLSAAAKSYSGLVLVPDSWSWVLGDEVRDLQRVCRSMKIRAWLGDSPAGVRRQAVYFAGQFVLLGGVRTHSSNRLGMYYAHGWPDGRDPVFVQCYDNLRREHRRFSRIRVSHSGMERLVLEAGVEPAKVHRIAIGVDTARFQAKTNESGAQARQKYGLPQSAVVIGSFQKDGVGWAEGLEPKLVKGPDVFLSTIGRLKDQIPEIFVFLSGPARGYVASGLEEMGVPFRHHFAANYDELSHMYHALDLYLVTSRDEGGPKAVLEAMASGVPLVTTRVGQAVDLVDHGKNAWIVDVEDIEALTHWARHALSDTYDRKAAAAAARRTAEQHDLFAQIPQWRAFFAGYVA